MSNQWIITLVNSENLTDSIRSSVIKVLSRIENQVLSDLYLIYGLKSRILEIDDSGISEYYNKIFMRHIVPIVYHLLIDYNIEYEDYKYISELIKKYTLDEPTRIDFENSVNGLEDIAYKKVNRINLSIEKDILSVYGKRQSIPQYRIDDENKTWRNHLFYI